MYISLVCWEKGMNVKWLIEKGVWHPKEEEALIEACKKLGLEYKLYEYKPFDKNLKLVNQFDDRDCVVVSGSINLTNAVMCETVWVPGVYAEYPNYLCSVYYLKLGDLLLNSEYVLVPFGDLNRLKGMLYRCFGKDNTIFIRPDSGKKSFRGKLVGCEHWGSEMEECKVWGIEDTEMVLISSPKYIDMEWRFFVADKEVFTGCLYYAAGLLEEDKELNKKAEELAQKVAKLYQPDRCFSIDICSRSGEFKVLEVNSGTSSGMYDCDIEKIVERFSAVAEDDYDNDNYSHILRKD